MTVHTLCHTYGILVRNPCVRCKPRSEKNNRAKEDETWSSLPPYSIELIGSYCIITHNLKIETFDCVELRILTSK